MPEMFYPVDKQAKMKCRGFWLEICQKDFRALSTKLKYKISHIMAIRPSDAEQPESVGN